MSEDENNEKKKFKDLKIVSENGLKISYDKQNLEKFTPNLLSEILNKKTSLKIDAIDYQIEQLNNEDIIPTSNEFSKELINPEAIDFIRRCKTNEQALEILNFLLERKELSQKDYNTYRALISQKGGLKKLIEETGGFKKSGYYEKKYYRKTSY